MRLPLAAVVINVGTATIAVIGARGGLLTICQGQKSYKRGSYSQWTWRDFTGGKTRVIPKMALEAPPRFPWRSACCQAPAVRGGVAPSPELKWLRNGGQLRLRRWGLAGTQLARAQCDTIRLKLLKIGVRIRVSVRAVRLSFDEGFPEAGLFGQVLARLQSLPLRC